MRHLRRPTVRTDIRAAVVTLVVSKRSSADGVAVQLARAGCDVRIAVDAISAVAIILRLRPAVVFLEPSPGLQIPQLRMSIRVADPQLEVVVVADGGREGDGGRSSALQPGVGLGQPLSDSSLSRILARARRLSSVTHYH